MEVIVKEIPEIKESDLQRFWSKVAITANDNFCWNWNGTNRDSKKPYGRMIFMKNGKPNLYSTHRVSYKINYGIDPKEFHVLHTCDNPKCVNPKHLFLGTNADNVKDKVSKKRQARNIAWNKGKNMPEYNLWNNNISKCSEDDYVEMKRMYENGEGSTNSISEKYGCAKKSLVKYIRETGGYVPKTTTVLSEDNVKNIRADYFNKGVRFCDLATMYNIGRKTISDIINRKTWKHI